MQQYLIRWPEVKKATNLSRTTAWRLEKEGKFPKRRKLSAHAVAWMSDEIYAWIASRKIVGGSNA